MSRLPPDAQARVDRAPPEYRALLTELWHTAQANTRPVEGMPIADTLRAIRAALDGKCGSTPEVQQEARTVMEGRLRSLRQRHGYVTVEAVMAGDPALGERFVAGCVRALRRIKLVRDGDITWHELDEAQRRAHARAIQDSVGDFGEDIADRRFP